MPDDNEDPRPTAAPATDELHEGGCLCGSVRYRATVGEAPLVSHCQCGMCRKATGATLVGWVLVPADGFAFTRGKPARFRSSTAAERRFCATCGCHVTLQVTNEAVDPSKRMWVALDSTDRPEIFDPTHQALTGDRLPWLKLSGGLQSWPGLLSGPRDDDSL